MNIDLINTQQYLEWLKNKLYLNAIAPNAQKRTVLRGQVYKCNLGRGVGSEEQKERPCVILQYNSANKTSPNTIVAPITHTTSTVPVVIPIKNKYDTNGNLILDGNALLGNIVCVSKARLGDYITSLTKSEMKEIDKAIAMSLDLKAYYDTLENKYNDKLIYIEKLKSSNTEMKNTINDLDTLLKQYNLKSIKELSAYIEKLKNQH